MIQANEIRIGNWLTSVLSDKPRKVTAIRLQPVKDGVFSSITLGYGTDSFLQDHLYSIHLTPEILLACGFKYQERDVNATKPIRFYISPNFGKHREYWLEMNFPLPGLDKFFWWLCWDQGSGRNHIHLPEGEGISEIHHLQNLWHSLSGTELQYNLPYKSA